MISEYLHIVVSDLSSKPHVVTLALVLVVSAMPVSMDPPIRSQGVTFAHRIERSLQVHTITKVESVFSTSILSPGCHSDSIQRVYPFSIQVL
ncbi:hypothetical protein DFS33DRAFT_250788 [Desarmillaria ectypa]|nr:hypothetical protein DFS33DRAFT_250788 [Desarmillaria ectypa]